MRDWTRRGRVEGLRWRAARWLRALGKRLAPAGVYLGDGAVLTRLVSGEVMLLDGRDRSVAPVLIMDGVWEPDVTQVVLRCVRPGMRALDVGANFGYFTLLLPIAWHLGQAQAPNSSPGSRAAWACAQVVRRSERQWRRNYCPP